ncbi:hypothetical protein KKA95_00065, partial [Patescibacteria group bacterium]|nr:hypothetical protein [Patescibacteria group bacterium]
MAKTGPKPDGLENMRGTKPTHFPVSSKRDELIGSTSNLRRIEGGRFVLPNIIAPTEILAKAEREVENIRVQLENIFTNTVVDDPTNVAGTVRTPDALPSGVKELMEKLDHYQRIIGQMGGNVREKIMRVYEE